MEEWDRASAAKTKLENGQRAMRKEEVERKEPWQMRYFARVESDEDCESPPLRLCGS